MKMSLNYYIEKIKSAEKELFMATCIILTGLLGFGLGRLSKLEDRRVPIIIKNAAVSSGQVITPIPHIADRAGYLATTTSNSEQRKFVASKSGSSYYFPWCNGVKRIKEGNKVWFNSAEEAAVAGYNKASNCPGL